MNQNNQKLKLHKLAFWAQLIALLTYLYVGVFVFDFPRKIEQIFILILFGIILEESLSWIVDKRFKFPISAVITSIAIFILVQSYTIYAYLFASLIALGSKYLIRIDGKHVFNPANIGVIVVILLFRGDVALLPGQWGVDDAYIIVAIAFGVLASSLANRITVGVSYFLSYALMCLVKSLLFGGSWLFYIGPQLGMAGLIFLLHMITDPLTTPRRISEQILFGSLIGCLDFCLRSFNIIHASFLALAIVSSLFVLISSKIKTNKEAF